MPYKEIHVPAAILVHLEKNAIVYYTYKCDNANDPNKYFYTFEEDSTEEFDVRELPQYDENKESEISKKYAGNIALYDEYMASIRSYHAEVVKLAFQNGDLSQEE